MNDALVVIFVAVVVWGAALFVVGVIMSIRRHARQIAALQADVRALRIAVERVS